MPRSTFRLNRKLRDSLGKCLTREEALILAKARKRQYGIGREVTDDLTDAELVLAATDADGRFEDDAVAANGWKYKS